MVAEDVEGTVNEAFAEIGMLNVGSAVGTILVRLNTDDRLARMEVFSEKSDEVELLLLQVEEAPTELFRYQWQSTF